MTHEGMVALSELSRRMTVLEQKLEALRQQRDKHTDRRHPAWNAKLDVRKVSSIKALLALGYSQHKLADLFSVSRAAIQAIHENKTWKHVSNGTQ